MLYASTSMLDRRLPHLRRQKNMQPKSEEVCSGKPKMEEIT